MVLMIVVGKKAVSYTHLDVYKRQIISMERYALLLLKLMDLHFMKMILSSWNVIN